MQVPPLTTGPVVEIPMLPFLNNFTYDVVEGGSGYVLNTVAGNAFPTSTSFQSGTLDIPTVTLQLQTIGTTKKGAKTSFKNTQDPISEFYLIYNSQTTYYDFAGTDKDDIQNYDASFSFVNITDTSNTNLAYNWSQLSTNNYGISLDLASWEFVKVHHIHHHGGHK